MQGLQSAGIEKRRPAWRFIKPRLLGSSVCGATQPIVGQAVTLKQGHSGDRLWAFSSHIRFRFIFAPGTKLDVFVPAIMDDAFVNWGKHALPWSDG